MCKPIARLVGGCLLLVLTSLLVGCGGASAPPATASGNLVGHFGGPPAGDAPVSTAPATATYTTQQATLAALPPIAPAGTAIPPPIPNPNDVLLFDTLEYTRSGGILGTTLTLVLRADGTFARDGVAGQVDGVVVQSLDHYLDEMRFFGLSGTFTALQSAPDAYQYHVRVSRAGEAWAIFGDEVYSPPELKQLYALIEGIGAPQPPTG